MLKCWFHLGFALYLHLSHFLISLHLVFFKVICKSIWRFRLPCLFGCIYFIYILSFPCLCVFPLGRREKEHPFPEFSCVDAVPSIFNHFLCPCLRSSWLPECQHVYSHNNFIHFCFYGNLISLDVVTSFADNFCNCTLFIIGYIYGRSLFVSVFRSQSILIWLKLLDLVLPIGFTIIFNIAIFFIVFSTESWLYSAIKLILSEVYILICTILLYVSLFALRRNLVQIKDGRVEKIDARITKNISVSIIVDVSILKEDKHTTSFDKSHQKEAKHSKHGSQRSMNFLQKPDRLANLWRVLVRSALVSTVIVVLVFYLVVRTNSHSISRISF